MVGKSNVDSKKITMAEASLGRFELQLQSENHNMSMWMLSSGQLKEVNERLKQIQIPTYLDFNPSYLFTHPSRLKSHDWKQVCMIMI